MKNRSSRLLFLSGLFLSLILINTCKKIEKTMLVATDEATNILTNSADLPGQIIDLGEGATQYGHYYGKSSNTLADHTALGTPGSLTGFTSQVTNLEAGTKYYFKAYLTDGQETVYGKEKTFTTLSASSPTLTTTAVTSITLTGAVSGGNITSNGGAPVSDRGVCWNSFTGPTTSNNKTVDGTGTGTYTSTLTGLTAGSTYFVRAYATNSAGTTYGNELTFTTTAASIPTVTTSAISGIAYNTALGGGNVTSDGGSPVLEKGVCWSSATGPAISNTKTTNGPGTGSFASDISGLSPTTKYYVRAYATNIVGTAYGSEVSFTTSNAPVQLPVLTTVSPGNVTSVSATSGGDISNDGGASVTFRGVCWNTAGSPTADGLKTTDGSGTGSFVSSITGLTPNIKYYVRAYAINSSGTGYGNEYNFTTLSTSSSVITTIGITSIAQTTASGGGNITSDGGSGITVRGICWSLNQNPTLADSFTDNGTGTGLFNSQLTNLSPGKTYYVRAYATNATGTTYGNQVSFLTASDIPKVTTSAIGAVTTTTAEAGGEVLDNNGSTVTTRGICYNTIGSPTISDNVKSESAAIGTFSLSLTGLTPNTTYYIRAFATNAIGTAYGNEVFFTTNSLTNVVPTLTTAAITNITSTSASSGGNITSNGGSIVTTSGVCWSTTPNPIATGNHSTDGSLTGSFTSSVTGLTYNKIYYVRAYATNSSGTGYGNEVQFKTLCIVPTVTTVAATNIGTTSATLNGTINANNLSTIPLFKYGTTTSYGSTINSTPYSVDGTTNIPISVEIINLTPGTLYHFVVLADACGTDIYGTDLTFTTLLPAPTITNFPDIVKSFGDPSFTLTAPTSNSSGAFSYLSSNTSVATISGSTVIINGVGTTLITANQAATSSYTAGTITANLTVNAIKPTLSTNAITAITSTSATSGGNISSNGGAAVTASGVCWSTTTAPAATGSHTTDGATTGTFVSSITGLTLGQIYYVRAYATNSAGTGYGNEVSFTAALAIGESYQGGILAYILKSTDPGWVDGQTRGLIVAPNDQSPAAEWGCSGTLISGADGIFIGTGNQNTTDIVAGCPTGGIAARICYDLVLGGYTDWYLPSENELNKIYSNRTTLGGFTDSYWTSTESNSSFSIYQDFNTGLLPNSYKYITLKVRAIRAFPAAPVLPAVSTTAASAITSTTATSGGNVLADGGADITARGVCWRTTTGPTIADSKTSDGTGTGVFTSSLTGLTPGQTYYVRAYATNSAGTNYGNEINFISSSSIPAVTTTSVSVIASTSVKSGGNVTSEGGSSILSQGVCWGTSADPTIAGTKTIDGSGTGIFTSNPTGLTPNTSYHLRAYATNSLGTAYGADILFSTTPLMTDGSGNSYNTIQIGPQLWMKENLKTTKYRDGTNIPIVTVDGTWASLLTGAYCEYSNNISNVADYGRLYNFYATIDNKNLCPTGWHVPTDAEWTSLLTYLGGDGVAGGKLKEKGISHWNTPNADATDESGFTGLPGGYRSNGGPYFDIGNYGQFWTSTPNSATNGLYYTLQYLYGNVPRYAYLKVGGFSVRCMQGEGQVLPAVTTAAITAITSTTATSGGNVTSAGNATVTARGVCWSTSTGPTISDTHTTDGSGLGAFSSSISGLTGDKVYYVRAYATNSVGTVYGNEEVFNTFGLAVGTAYQGGVIAYIFQSGDPGYVAGQIHGLIATTTDQSTGAIWGCSGTALTGADGTVLGTGNSNTSDIVTGCTTAGIAARICSDLSFGGYSDWYLPSKDELEKLYLNRTAIGGFTNNAYWSSSEDSASNSWICYFYTGTIYVMGKTNAYHIRAIRSF